MRGAFFGVPLIASESVGQDAKRELLAAALLIAATNTVHAALQCASGGKHHLTVKGVSSSAERKAYRAGSMMHPYQQANKGSLFT
jgi:hypothetical protein